MGFYFVPGLSRSYGPKRLEMGLLVRRGRCVAPRPGQRSGQRFKRQSALATARENAKTPAIAGVPRMELGGLEPPTSWVRSRQRFAPSRLARSSVGSAETSPGQTAIGPSAKADASAFLSRSTATTLAPSSTSCSATLRPMPWAAPVTTAVLPENHSTEQTVPAACGDACAAREQARTPPGDAPKMARPGLEPGMPRLSVVGQNPSNRPTIPASQAGLR